MSRDNADSGCRIPKNLSFLCDVLSPWTAVQRIQQMQAESANRNVDWAAVCLNANRANLTPALWHALHSRGMWPDIPSEMKAYLNEIHRLNTVRNQSLLNQLTAAIGFLNTVGIIPMLLKGSDALTTNLFPDLADRFMADIDLLIPNDKMDLAVDALKQHDYFVSEAYLRDIPWSEDQHHSAHYAPLFHHDAVAPIELHRRVLHFGELLDDRAVWQESIRITSSRLPGATLALMSPTHQIVHCFFHSELSHQNHHFKRIDLRQMHHFAYLCFRWRNQIDWNHLGGILKDRNIGCVLRSWLYLSQRFWGVEIPLPFNPDTYAIRHCSKVIHFLDGKWKWLRVLHEFFCLIQQSLLTETQNTDLFLTDRDMTNILPPQGFGVLFGRYARIEPWKELAYKLYQKFDTMG